MQGEKMGDKCPYDCKDMEDVKHCQEDIKKSLPRKASWKWLVVLAFPLIGFNVGNMVIAKDARTKTNDKVIKLDTTVESFVKAIEKLETEVKRNQLTEAKLKEILREFRDGD